jgi:ribosome biogenesis protein Nip4
MNDEIGLKTILFEIEGPLIKKVYAKSCEIMKEKVRSFLIRVDTIYVHHNDKCEYSYSLPLKDVVKKMKKQIEAKEKALLT